MTLYLQVIDTGVNNPFEDHLNQLHSEWLLQGIMFFSYTNQENKKAQCRTVMAQDTMAMDLSGINS
jgi:hypothetical protein